MNRPQEFDHQAVVAAALEVYWERGMHRASVDEILKATGLARSSLYNSFGSKEGLFEEALKLYVEGQVERFQKIAAADRFQIVLEQLFRGPVEANFEGRGCLLSNCASTVMRDEVTHQTLIREGFERIFDTLAKRIEKAQSDGELSLALDPATVAILVCSTLSGLRLFRKTGMSTQKLKKAANLATTSFMSQCAPDSTP